MQIRILCAALVWSVCVTTPALAQFKERDAGGPKLGDSQVQYWRVGLTVRAVGGACRGIVGTTAVPVDWPEQEVRIVDEEISPAARVTERTVGGTVKQMVVTIANLPAGREAKAIRTMAIKRYAQLAPDNTGVFVLPDLKKLDRRLRIYLAPSPKIESRNAKIRKLAKQIGVEEENAWDRVEAIYDWVRQKVQYKKNEPLKGAPATLKDGVADCEGLTSLFIALCRAADVPARTVWVPGHCYPEFYLVDDKGKGHWFPCQVAGSRAFGGIPEYRPILQKGDSFSPPHNRREKQRYLADYLVGAGRPPMKRFIREQVAKP